MGAVGDIAGGLMKYAYAGEDEKNARDLARKNQTLAQGLDYEPEYASNLVAPYQKSQSPLADGYLNSILTGSNPATTFSGAPNAASTKQYQQSQQNKMFGTPAARMAQEQKLATVNPYVARTPADSTTSTVKNSSGLFGAYSQDPTGTHQETTPGRQVGKDRYGGSDIFAATTPGASAAGLTLDTANAMRKEGIAVNFGEDGSVALSKGMWRIPTPLTDDQATSLVSLYNSGDKDGLDAFLKKFDSTVDPKNKRDTKPLNPGDF